MDRGDTGARKGSDITFPTRLDAICKRRTTDVGYYSFTPHTLFDF